MCMSGYLYVSGSVFVCESVYCVSVYVWGSICECVSVNGRVQL